MLQLLCLKYIYKSLTKQTKYLPPLVLLSGPPCLHNNISIMRQGLLDNKRGHHKYKTCVYAPSSSLLIVHFFSSIFEQLFSCYLFWFVVLLFARINQDRKLFWNLYTYRGWLFNVEYSHIFAGHCRVRKLVVAPTFLPKIHSKSLIVTIAIDEGRESTRIDI